MRFRVFRFVVALGALVPGIVVQACQTETPDPSIVATGTETNWLRSCSRDAECGALTCECGVCTRRCADETSCNLPNAVCSPASGGAVPTLCGDKTPSFDLCLPSCNETCAAGQVCVAGACIPSADASTRPDASETASGANTTAIDVDVTSSNDSSDFATDADSSPETLDSGTASRGDTSLVTSNGTSSTPDAQTEFDGGSTADANLGCPLDTRPLTPGCCYLDTDCDEGQACYQAACSGDVMAPGRCAFPPASPNCFADRDCNAGEVCQGGLLALCGTAGPDSLGTCVPDCEFDSCHPERCDEVGEPCCDPLPADGPNYCNADLECTGATCEARAETTTPEALAQQACEETGGTWDFESCGHYVCGQPPNCAAVIPGCDCGPGSSFDTSGCFTDAQCTSQ